MPLSRDELDQMDTITLAVECGECDENLAEEARRLKCEWAMLVSRQNEPKLAYVAMKKLEHEERALRARMIKFLSGHSHD